MFSSTFKADCLWVNLQLVINHLKVLEKEEKTEPAQKAREEVADHLAAGRHEGAQIRREHIVQEDHLMEATEILGLYCDPLLARLSLIQPTKEPDSGLAKPVSTLIWAAPQLQSQVPESKIVPNQLCAKYS
ncbi:IST1 homolog [Lemur catta]|uniref:IST1 homolog n=1 Tax=Lemur catta TaxID=9447 RepID=UPI001E268960|nr:IST1 homolog [Lemur catta]